MTRIPCVPQTWIWRVPRNLMVVVMGICLAGGALGADPEPHQDQKAADAPGEHADHPQGTADWDHDEPDHVDLVRLTPAEQEEFGIVLATAGPGVLQRTRRLPAEVHTNADRVAHITPRYDGIATEVRVQMGDTIAAGQVLAIVESDDTLAEYALTSSLAGVVIEKHMTPGEPVGRGHTVLLIADLRTVWIDIAVYQRDLSLVTPGRSAVIHGADDGPSAPGRIGYVAPVVDPHTRTATARVELPNPDGRWRPGMFVTAEVSTTARDVPVLVPATAVHRLGATDVVFVATDAGFVPRTVILGEEGATGLEIRAGLVSGERYVADGGFTLKAELAKESFGSGHAH